MNKRSPLSTLPAKKAKEQTIKNSNVAEIRLYNKCIKDINTLIDFHVHCGDFTAIYAMNESSSLSDNIVEKIIKHFTSYGYTILFKELQSLSVNKNDYHYCFTISWEEAD